MKRTLTSSMKLAAIFLATLLLSRLAQDPTPRPLMAAADAAGQLAALFEHRRPLYSQADLRISQAGEGPEAVAALVLQGLPSILKERPGQPETAALLSDGDGDLTPSLN